MNARARNYLILLILCALVGSNGCGSHGSGSTVATAPEQDLRSLGILRVRWFPVAEAEGYLLEIESADGELLLQEAAEPTGCTHDASEGYTSGICSYDIKLPDANGSYGLKLSAFNGAGQSSRSVARIAP